MPRAGPLESRASPACRARSLPRRRNGCPAGGASPPGLRSPQGRPKTAGQATPPYPAGEAFGSRRRGGGRSEGERRRCLRTGRGRRSGIWRRLGRCWRARRFPCTLHPTPYTLHPTPYTLHPTIFLSLSLSHTQDENDRLQMELSLCLEAKAIICLICAIQRGCLREDDGDAAMPAGTWADED